MSNIEKNSQRTPADKNKALEAVLRSHQTRIRVVGCGGCGNNTISRLMEAGVKGIETLAINTDAQNLLATMADDKILIGQNITKGLGAGSNPQIGEDSARENQPEIEEALLNTDLVFVTCGLGGGTGTGSAPVVAEVANKINALTISIVTLPFTEEGVSRRENARIGLEKLRRNSDTVIVIENDRLLEVVPDLPLDMAFKVADEILVNAVKGITELITEKGLINLDFADVRTIMQNGGTAMIGIGESDGAESAQVAVEMAMQNKLLDIDITGAKNALINITGGAQMPLKDAKLVMKTVADKLDPSAKIIWGARIDQNLGKIIRVMVIATGLHEKREAAVERDEKRKSTVTAKLSVQADRVEALPIDLQKDEVRSPNAALKKSAAETDMITEGVSANGNSNESFLPTTPSLDDEKAGKRDQASPKRKRKAPLSKPRRNSEALISDKQVQRIIESSEQVIARDDVVRVTFADGLAPRESDLVTPTSNADKISYETKGNAEAAKQNNSETITNAKDPVSSSAASDSEKKYNREEAQIGAVTSQRDIPPTRIVPEKDALDGQEYRHVAQSVKADESLGDRQDFDQKLNSNDRAAKIKNEVKMPAAGDITNILDQAAQKSAPTSSKANDHNKIFSEQSRVHLQIIRESIGHLFTDPTRQETLQRIKHAAIAVNNLAKRFVFDVIADYAATIEEICERVLDGEINMNKKLVNAFTEIPAIFDNMVHGDADAPIEAKRHQERLQRLADSFVDGEVIHMDTSDKRNAPVNPASRPPSTSTPRFSLAQKPSPLPTTRTAPSSERRPRPATEVMEYLDDLFAEGKKP